MQRSRLIPRAISCSAHRASASADSAVTRIYAFRCTSSCAMRASIACVNSTGDRCRCRNCGDTSPAAPAPIETETAQTSPRRSSGRVPRRTPLKKSTPTKTASPASIRHRSTHPERLHAAHPPDCRMPPERGRPACAIRAAIGESSHRSRRFRFPDRWARRSCTPHIPFASRRESRRSGGR